MSLREFPKPTRREVVGGLFASLISAPRHNALAQNTAPTFSATSVIDLHHHFVPPTWIARYPQLLGAAAGLDTSTTKQWTPERSLERMDANGVAFAVISGPFDLGFASQESVRAAVREANEFAAQAVRDHPARLAFFAMLPMPYLDDTLRELDHCLGTLKATGVTFLTNYNGRYFSRSSISSSASASPELRCKNTAVVSVIVKTFVYVKR
jgi:6-methylsalicylate decarboxylase